MFIDLLQSPYFLYFDCGLRLYAGACESDGLVVRRVRSDLYRLGFWPLGRFYSESAGKLRTGAFILP